MGLKEGVHGHLSSCICRVGLREVGVSTGLERSRREVQLSVVRKMSRSEGGEGIETVACISR